MSAEMPGAPRRSSYKVNIVSIIALFKSAPEQSGFKQFLRARKGDLVVVLILAFSMQLAEYHGWLAGIEGKVLNWFLTPDPRSVTAGDVLTIEIDDDAYRDCFCDTSPLNPRHVLNLVEFAASARPAVIGIDILTNSTKYAETYNKARLPANMATIWAAEGPAVVETASFPEWLFGKPDRIVVRTTTHDPTNTRQWGVPVYPRDEDLKLRRFPGAILLQGIKQPTWARKVAIEYCKYSHQCEIDESRDEIYLTYKRRPAGRFRVSELFACSNTKVTPCDENLSMTKDGPRSAEFLDRSRGKVVLIGGTFGAARDDYETPLGRVPGLLLNAYSAQADIDKTGISEIWRPITLLLDVIVGWLIVFLFWRWRPNHEVRWAMAVNLSWVVVAIALSFLFMRGFLWFSCVGVAAGIVLGILVDVWRANPQVQHQD